MALPVRYEPTWESVAPTRCPTGTTTPSSGVFLHWGLYSVPGWAPQVPDIQQLLQRPGARGRCCGTTPTPSGTSTRCGCRAARPGATSAHTYGPDATYDDFVAAVRRRHRRRGHGRPRRGLPRCRRALRRAHHQAPRGLLPVAHRAGASAQGPLPRPPGPRRRPDARPCATPACAWACTTPAATTGPTTTRCWPTPPTACWRSRDTGDYVRVRHRARARADRAATSRRCCGTTSAGPPAATWPRCSPSTTTPCPTG